MIKIFLLSAVIFFTYLSPSYAYIPKLRTIVKNIGDKRSDKSRLLTSEVMFTLGTEKLLITEKWYIKDDNNIYLEATGPGFNYRSLHRNGKRYRLNSKDQVVSLETDSKFFMPLFLSSDPNTIASYLVRLGIAPSSLLERQETKFNLEEIVHQPEQGIRLTRLDGVVTYGIGEPMPKDSNQPTKHLWIVQDDFFVKKLRGEGYIIEAGDYKKYKGGFWFPKSLNLKWKELSVEASTVNLEPINVGPKTKKKFELSYLQDNRPSPNEIQIQDLDSFYQMFR